MSFDPSSYPYDTVVYVTDTIGGLGWQGSGVLISPDEVLTASHVVYSSSSGSASDITIVPAYNSGTDPFGSASGTYIHYFQIQDPNDTIAPQQSQYDYAVIHLSRAFAGLGTMGLEADFSGGQVNVTGYPAAMNGQMENSAQNVSIDPIFTLLDGTSIGQGSSGGPVWTTNSNGAPYVVGVVSSSAGGVGGLGYFTQITAVALNQIEAWITQDDAAPGSTLAVYDTSAAQSLSASAQPYTGPVANLQNEYINLTSDSLNISASSPGWFIHSGSGSDAIAVDSGTNVLDGGTGSNFLTGGTGTDTFFIDDRGPAADIWSSVVNFHSGDAATLWGVSPDQFSLAWADGQGAQGYTGLTLHASAAGRPNASLTLVGFTGTDLSDGRLSVSYGTDPASGSTYMYVHANS